VTTGGHGQMLAERSEIGAPFDEIHADELAR
jgi:hypothetical protein